MRVTLKPVFWKLAQDGLNYVALKDELCVDRERWTDVSDEKSTPIPEKGARAF
jgi:hypothetical protein